MSNEHDVRVLHRTFFVWVLLRNESSSHGIDSPFVEFVLGLVDLVTRREKRGRRRCHWRTLRVVMRRRCISVRHTGLRLGNELSGAGWIQSFLQLEYLA